MIAAPLGILAGTYLAEYGRYAASRNVVRFINDILLSAPSIVVGLFVYQFCVVPFGHFSALRRRRRARRDRDADHRSHDRGHAEPGA